MALVGNTDARRTGEGEGGRVGGLRCVRAHVHVYVLAFTPPLQTF